MAKDKIIMKKNIFSSLLILAAVSLAFASCDESYLETAPESATSPATIFETTDAAALAVNGLSKMMTTQYLGTQGMNGEGTIKSWYSAFMGQDAQKCGNTEWAPIWNFQSNYMESTTSIYAYYGWYYYYKLIGNANQIIVNIDNATGLESEKAYIKAQGLVFRAYSFFMLSQMYCNRWVDSNNGASNGIVLRIDTSTGDQALATLGETYAQVYADLDEAIKLFNESGIDRSDFYEPNIDVAYAVYARAALTREDWSNAAKYAALAKANYPLMSKKDYTDGGFSTPNDEWIWGVYEAEDQTLYYYSLWAYMSSNASSGACRNYPLAISKELYDQIPETDVRRNMWIAPTAEEYAKSINKTSGAATGTFLTRAKSEFGSKLYSTSSVYMYMQVKFQCSFLPGGGSFHIFRATEMYLTEAEADCHLNKDAEAQAILYTLNKRFDSSYNCTKTGATLLEEVKLYRRIDLWGEGNDWFDCKRWNITLNRKSIANGGSFHQTFAITREPQECNKWTWAIPKKETDYNKLVK